MLRSEEVLQLLKEEKIEEALENYIPLIKTLVRRYIIVFPKLHEDFLSEGIVAALRVLRNLKTEEHNNPGAAVNKAVVGACNNYLYGIPIIHEKRNNKNIRGDYPVVGVYIEEEEDGKFYPLNVPRQSSILSQVIVNDVMTNSIFSSTEQAVMRLRSEGYLEREIGDQLDMSQKKVSRMLEGLKRRVRYLLK